MRVLLVYPNAKKEIIGWGDLGAIAEPIALEYIGAGAKLDGHHVKLLDLPLHNEDLQPPVNASHPAVHVSGGGHRGGRSDGPFDRGPRDDARRTGRSRPVVDTGMEPGPPSESSDAGE